METWLAILISQIPLGIACIVATYELYRFRLGYKENQERLSELIDKIGKILDSLSKRAK
jgi:hypothetical protein